MTYSEISHYFILYNSGSQPFCHTMSTLSLMSVEDSTKVVIWNITQLIIKWKSFYFISLIWTFNYPAFSFFKSQIKHKKNEMTENIYLSSWK